MQDRESPIVSGVERQLGRKLTTQERLLIALAIQAFEEEKNSPEIAKEKAAD